MESTLTDVWLRAGTCHLTRFRCGYSWRLGGLRMRHDLTPCLHHAGRSSEDRARDYPSASTHGRSGAYALGPGARSVLALGTGRALGTATGGAGSPAQRIVRGPSPGCPAPGRCGPSAGLAPRARRGLTGPGWAGRPRGARSGPALGRALCFLLGALPRSRLPSQR